MAVTDFFVIRLFLFLLLYLRIRGFLPSLWLCWYASGHPATRPRPTWTLHPRHDLWPKTGLPWTSLTGKCTNYTLPLILTSLGSVFLNNCDSYYLYHSAWSWAFSKSFLYLLNAGPPHTLCNVRHTHFIYTVYWLIMYIMRSPLCSAILHMRTEHNQNM